MFPLSVVLLPGVVLPLRLFEPRYLEMYEEISAGDREFGIVLIERGSEAGGDDVRFGFGCVARVVGSGLHEDGTLSLVTVGVRRLRVAAWLEDGPFPRAEVELLDDEAMSEIGLDFMAEARESFTDLHRLFSELGAASGSFAPSLPDEPIAAAYQMARLSGLQELDMQRVLEAPTSDLRAGLVKDLLGDQVHLMELRLEVG